MAIIFKDISSDFLYGFIVFTTIIYIYIKYLYSYWDRRGVKSLPPSFPFGNFARSFLQKTSIGELTQEFYRSTKEPFIGVYGALRPILILRDPELIRSIFVKDFQSFHDRGVHSDEKNDPLSGHLFSLNGDKWKNLRMKLSPTFTSGKLKAMFSTLVDCGDTLQKYMDKVALNSDTVEVRDISARYMTNVIASVAFGANINCIDNPNTSFRKYGKKFFDINLKNGLRLLLTFVYPPLLKFFKIRVVDRDVEDFMTAMVEQTMEYREKNNVVRKDFFQLLVQLRNTGNVQLDDQWETVISNDEKGKMLTIKEVTAQAFVFFLAGFETSSTTLSYCLYELARNSSIQQKVQEEIDSILQKHNGKITYDSINEMKFLECCIDETLRKYPPVPILNRECTKEYQMPGTNVMIEKGTSIIIPAYAIQHDDKYFPNPEEFIPDRFSEQNRAGKTFVDMPYMSFGEGPRICIGLRLGKIQTKVGLVLMLQKYTYYLGKQHINKDLKFTPAAIILTPTTGIELKVKTRKLN